MASLNFENIKYEKRDAIAILTINREDRLNAILVGGFTIYPHDGFSA